MSLKHLIFQKGGIGESLSRQDTIARINPIIKQHLALNHRYDAAIESLSDPAAAEILAEHQKKARADVGKLCETIYSAGGVAYTGVDMEPAAFRTTGDDDDQLFRLLDEEQALQDAVAAEFDLRPEHQIRTQAILLNVRNNSRGRLDALQELTSRRTRKTPTSA